MNFWSVPLPTWKEIKDFLVSSWKWWFPPDTQRRCTDRQDTTTNIDFLPDQRARVVSMQSRRVFRPKPCPVCGAIFYRSEQPIHSNHVWITYTCGARLKCRMIDLVNGVFEPELDRSCQELREGESQ